MPSLQLMLFTNDADLARAAAASDVDRLVVDLEQRGKHERQHGYHLECNANTIADVARMKAATSVPVVCRVNSLGHDSASEIEEALEAGADVVMLPMFKSFGEVTSFLRLVDGRAKTSLLFETREAVDLAPGLAGMPFDEVYVGLNDLGLSYGKQFCYQLMADGTVDRVRACFPDKPFGFGGLTVLDGGQPLAARLIVKELARLRCTQVILRRAFKRDVVGRDMAVEVQRLKAFYAECRLRTAEESERDRVAVAQAIMEIGNTVRMVEERIQNVS